MRAPSHWITWVRFIGCCCFTKCKMWTIVVSVKGWTILVSWAGFLSGSIFIWWFTTAKEKWEVAWLRKGWGGVSGGAQEANPTLGWWSWFNSTGGLGKSDGHTQLLNQGKGAAVFISLHSSLGKPWGGNGILSQVLMALLLLYLQAVRAPRAMEQLCICCYLWKIQWKWVDTKIVKGFVKNCQWHSNISSSASSVVTFYFRVKLSRGCHQDIVSPRTS